jgi:hypothetical protein
VEESRTALDRARRLPEESKARKQATRRGRSKVEQALRLHKLSSAAWLALAEALLLSGDEAEAAAAGQRAIILNPTLKAYADQPETGLGPDPELLSRLLAIDAFRRLWDTLPDGQASQ